MNSLTHFTFFITIVCFFEGINGKPPRHIIDGIDAQIGEYPFMVALENGYTRQTCGAMLISPKHVLTAAHCIIRGREENDPYMYQLRHYHIISGDVNRKNRQTTQTHEVVRIDVHKSFMGYPAPWHGDIAILTLKENVDIGPTRQPAALASRRYSGRELGIILGWGWTKAENSISIDQLKKGKVALEGYMTGKKLSAIGIGATTFCNGDSGGPLYLNHEIIGIISYSLECTERSSGTFTDVYAYRTWIEEIMRGEDSEESAANIRIL